MQNLIQRYKDLDKALLFLRNQAFCLKIWKLWRAPTTLQFNIFCWNFAHVFYLPMSTKAYVGFYLFCLDLELFANIKKDLVSTHSFYTLLLITQDLNKIKKIPLTFLETLLSRKSVQDFSKKILSSMVVGARQSFQFFWQKTWFLGNNRGLL